MREVYESKVELRKEFDVLKFKAKVISPGTWTGRSGVPYTYTEESVQAIFENIDKAKPVEIWHDGVPCGVATKFYIENGELYAEGIIYDQADAILEAGIDKVSPELTLYVNDDGVVISGTLEKIAFVKNPGIKPARVLEVEKAAFEDGGDNMLEKLLEFLKDKLSADDYAAVEAMINAMKEKYPYPYPYPKPQAEELEAKVEELEAKVEEYERRIEEYEKELNEYREKEMKLLEEQYSKLANELAQKGFDVEKLVEGIDDVRMKLDILRRAKEAYAESIGNVQVETGPDMSRISEAAKALGLTERQVIEILRGGE